MWNLVAMLVPLVAPFLLFGVGMTLNRVDAALKLSRALPAAASSTVTSPALDLQNSTRGDFLAKVEFLLSAPAVTTTMLPNGDTITYNVIESVNADLSSPTVLIAGAITQTGAGGAGAAAATYRFRLPTNVNRYLGFQAVSGSGVTDSSSKSATLQPLF